MTCGVKSCADAAIGLTQQAARQGRLQKSRRLDAYCETGLHTVWPASVVASSYPAEQLGAPYLS